MLAALAVLVGWAAWFELQNWNATKEAGEASVRARAEVLAENTARALAVADVALRSLQSVRLPDIQDEQSSQPLSQSTVLPSQIPAVHLRGLSEMLPQLQSFGLVDRRGWLFPLSMSGDAPSTPVLVGDRDYFRYFAEGGSSQTLFVSEPLRGRLTGSWVVVLSRAILDDQRKFAGVAVVILDLGWFRSQHQMLAEQEDLNVILYSQNERVVTATYARPPIAGGGVAGTIALGGEWTGQKAGVLPLFGQVPWKAPFQVGPLGKGSALDGASHTSLTPTVTSQSTYEDGSVSGIVALKQVPGAPLALAVERSWDNVLAPFYQGLVRDTGLLSVMVLVLVAMWGPAARATRDRDRLFDISPDPVCITDTSGRFLRVNPAWSRVLGYSSAELSATSHLDLVYPKDREEARRLHARLLAGEAVQDAAIRYKTASGQPLWLSWSAVAEGNRVFAIARDMTRRREAERALQASEERFRDVAEALGEFIWEIDSEGLVTFLSDRARATLGVAPADLLGRPLVTCLDAGSRQKMTMAMMRGTPFVLEVVADRSALRGAEVGAVAGSPLTPQGRQTPSGQYIWLRLSGVPVLTPDGGVRGFRGAGVDVTESKVSRQALADSEARYRSIVNTVVDGIITIDERGVIQSLNPAAEAIFGYSARELVGRNVSALVEEVDQLDDEVAHSVLDILRRCLGDSGEKEVTGRRKDGASFPLELGVSEVYFGSQRFMIGMCRDVSERKRMERMKDEFVSTVSHELRTPLTSIRGSLGLIAGGVVGELPEKARRLVEIAHSNCERLVNLVNDILDIQKIEAGSMAFDMVPLDLSAVVARAVEENAALAAHDAVVLQVEGNEDTVKVVGDFNRLLQVMTNLLSNAIKFSPAGETVQVMVQRRKGRVRVEVVDHGPGIPKQFRSHIFQKFSQADATDTRSKGGTGLGLSISKAITERHNGILTFESEEGDGSTFILDLPLVEPPKALPVERLPDAATAVGEPPEEVVSEPEGEKPGQAPRVLVVEDDPDVAHLLQLLLAGDGLASDVAGDATQALERLNQEHYAAVTVDVLLPDSDGLTLARQVRNCPGGEDVPLIVVSAIAQESRRRLEGAALGIIDWIRKPIDEERLKKALRQAIPAVRREPMAVELRVLHIDDDSELRHVVAEILAPLAQVTGVASLADARALLANRGEQTWDVVVLDLRLPDGDGSELLPLLQAEMPQAHVVVLSAKELAPEDAHKVAAALRKSQVSNQQILATIRRVAFGGLD